MIRRIGRRVDKDLSSILFIDQWVILTGWGLSYDTLNWPALRPLIPEKDRYCADPFVIERDDAYYVFVDEKIYATGLGRIVCLTLDQKANIRSHQIVLERPYHLSYPFLFEYQGAWYLLPESAANRTIELWCLEPGYPASFLRGASPLRPMDTSSGQSDRPGYPFRAPSGPDLPTGGKIDPPLARLFPPLWPCSSIQPHLETQ